MSTLSHTVRPLQSPASAARPRRGWLARMMLRWWLQLCRQAERPTRVVPRY